VVGVDGEGVDEEDDINVCNKEFWNLECIND
jgi:hypothetical protein